MSKFCPKCGFQLADDAAFCPKCGCNLNNVAPQQPAQNQYADPVYAQPASAQYQAPAGGNVCPPNYLVFAILTTIFCCWPFGIPAIVNAAKVNGAFKNGMFQAAAAFSANAKKWSIIALIFGVVAYIIYIIYVMVAGVAFFEVFNSL